jgi:hypothetical protein
MECSLNERSERSLEGADRRQKAVASSEAKVARRLKVD